MANFFEDIPYPILAEKLRFVILGGSEFPTDLLRLLTPLLFFYNPIRFIYYQISHNVGAQALRPSLIG